MLYGGNTGYFFRNNVEHIHRVRLNKVKTTVVYIYLYICIGIGKGNVKGLPLQARCGPEGG